LHGTLNHNLEVVRLTNTCNNSCVFCEYLDKRAKKEKTFEEIKKEIDWIKNKREKTLVFSGEPTIMQNLFEILEYARSVGFKSVQIRTNGRMFYYPEFAEKVARLVDSFDISLFSHRPEIHDKITRVPGSFEQTVQGIRNLKRLGKHVRVEVLIIKDNYKSLTEIVDLLAGLGVNWIQFRLFDMTYNPRKDLYPKLKNFVPKYSEIAPFLNDISNYVERLNRDRKMLVSFIN
jgi:MoaA/NifB/PqqE/SkfB family radical SAM enzyme